MGEIVDINKNFVKDAFEEIAKMAKKPCQGKYRCLTMLNTSFMRFGTTCGLRYLKVKDEQGKWAEVGKLCPSCGANADNTD